MIQAVPEIKRRSFLVKAVAFLASMVLPRRSDAGLGLRGSSPYWTPGQRPFAAASPINQPLPTGAILVPVNWPGPFTQGFYYCNPKFAYDQPASGAPVVALTNTQLGWGNNPSTRNKQMTIGFNNIGQDTDNEAVSIINNICESDWVFSRTSNTTATCLQYAACDIVLDWGVGASQTGVPGGSIASGILGGGSSAMAGAAVREEFDANYPNGVQHVLALCLLYTNTAPGYYYPMINYDASAPTGFVQYGQRMAIPKTASPPAGLSTPYGLQFFKTMQNFGAIISDTGINQFYAPHSFNNSTSWTGPQLTALAADAILLIPMLEKVGYPADGINSNMAIYTTSAPQLQQLSYAGKEMNVSRDSGGAMDIGFTAAPQSLLDTTSITSFCSGTTGRVAKRYDQSGNGHDFTSTGANAPIIFASGSLKTVNGTAAMAFDGTNHLTAFGTSGGYPNGNTTLLFFGTVSNYAGNNTLVGPDTAGGLQLRADASTGLVRLLKNGGATVGITPYPFPLTGPVAVSAFYNADGSYAIWMNGIEMVRGTGTLVSMTAANIRIGAGPGGADALVGSVIASLVSSNNSGQIGQQQYVMEQYYKLLAGPFGTVIVNTTTLDPAHRNGSALLGNGNLTVFDGVNGNVNAFSTVSKSSGTPYCEVTCDNAVGFEVFGIGNNSLSTGTFQYPGSDLNSIGYANDGTVRINGATVATLATWTSGNTMAMFFDITHSKIWFGIINGSTILWNNDVLANQNPATNTGGISTSTLNAGPYFAVCSPAQYSSQQTINFNGSAYQNQTLVPSNAQLWQ